MKVLTLIRASLLMVCLAPNVRGQEAQPVSSQVISAYLDCQDGGCDFDYLRTEIAFVNWVRDRQVADVHILVTSQATGSGGREYTATFIGLREFANLTDTLVYAQPPAATDDERRGGLAQLFRAGLVRYVARTPAASRLSITMGGGGGRTEQALTPDDPWNNWVFRASVSGHFDGEETYKSLNLRANFNADRITAAWKTRINGSESYSQSDFEVDDTTNFVSIQRSYGASVLQVKSMGDHWSIGARIGMRSSTYDNLLRSVHVLPALEYNLFPYEESTRRQLRVEYNVGIARFDYRDTTIFDQLRDDAPLHRLVVSAAAKQPWGSLDVGVLGTHYLHRAQTYRVGSFGDVSWRLFRGFDLGLFGAYEIIHDQFGLAKKDFTPEEILTRQFRRGTTFNYWGGLRLSYTFGSIFNNVVNPRMVGNSFD